MALLHGKKQFSYLFQYFPKCCIITFLKQIFFTERTRKCAFIVSIMTQRPSSGYARGGSADARRGPARSVLSPLLSGRGGTRAREIGLA